MPELDEKERALAEALWEQIPPQTSTILGTDVSLGKMKISVGVEELAKRTYYATLRTERPREAELFFGFDDRSAIAFSGLLVMMQDKVINEKMSRRDMDEDDLDAMSECVNQLGSAVNKALHATLGPDYHAVMSGGGMSIPSEIDKYSGQRIVVIRGKLSIGSLHTGEFRVILPEILFKTQEDIDQGTDPLALTPEEQQALREATLEGLDGGERILLYLPLERDEMTWRSQFEQSALEFGIVRDLHQIRRECKSGEAHLVVVDADACAQGGLPALARLLSWADVNVPVVVAASRPTRSHLVACLAAGSATYLVKPIDAHSFREQVAQLLEVWHQHQISVA